MTIKDDIKQSMLRIINSHEILKYDDLVHYVEIHHPEANPEIKLTALSELIQANQIKRLEYTINRSTIRPFYMAANCSLM